MDEYANFYGDYYGESTEAQQLVPEFWRNKYEKDASRNWDFFYKQNTTKAYKDRHWLLREFQELKPTGEQIVAIEVGCGVGNTVFPLISQNPNLFFYAMDFSPRAIQMLKEHTQFNEKKCNPFVCDIVNDQFPDFIKNGSIDCCVFIFCLSANPPKHMHLIVQKIHKVLKKGGLVLVRDYAVEDMAQKRFEKSPGEKKLGENFYVRHDGTMSYFFTTDFLRQLFSEQNGFEEIENKFIHKQVENVKLGLKMNRVFIQAKFKKM